MARRGRAVIAASLLALALTQGAQGWHGYAVMDDVWTHYAGHGYVRCMDPGDVYKVDPTVGDYANGGPSAETQVITFHGRWVKPGHWTVFEPLMCDNLMDSLNRPDAWTASRNILPQLGFNWLIFTHELGHMTGGYNWKSEKAQTCYALNNVQAVLTYMGLPAEYLPVFYAAVVIAYGNMPDGYRLKGCKFAPSTFDLSTLPSGAATTSPAAGLYPQGSSGDTTR